MKLAAFFILTVLMTTFVPNLSSAQNNDSDSSTSPAYVDPIFEKELRNTTWERRLRLSGQVGASYWRDELAVISFLEQVSVNNIPTISISSKEVTNYDYVSNEKSEQYYAGISVWADDKEIEISAGFAGTFTVVRGAAKGADCLLLKGEFAPASCFVRK